MVSESRQGRQCDSWRWGEPVVVELSRSAELESSSDLRNGIPSRPHRTSGNTGYRSMKLLRSFLIRLRSLSTIQITQQVSAAQRRAKKPMRTKNVIQNDSDDIRPEYDLAKLKGGVRGKYFKRATAGTILVLLEPDVAAAFPDANAVNQALRALASVAQSQSRAVSSTRELPNTGLQPPASRVKKSAGSKAISRSRRLKP